MADGDVTAGIRAAGFQPTQKSPLEMASQAATLANTISYNKLINQNVLNAQQELLNKQQELEVSKQGLSVKKTDRMFQGLASVLTADEADKPAVAKSVLDTLVANGDISQENYNRVKPVIDSGDTKAITKLAVAGFATTLSPEAAARNLFPQYKERDVGGQIQTGYTTPPVAAPGGTVQPPTFQQTGSIDKTLSPADKATTVETTDFRPTIPDPKDPSKTIPNPNFNTPQKLFVGDLVTALGHGNWVGPRPNIPGVSPQAAPAAGGAAAPGAAPAQAAPAQAAPAQAAPAQAGGGPTGPAPQAAAGGPTVPTFRTGPSEQLKKQAEVSTALYNTDKLAATNYKQSLFPTEQIYQLANTKGVDLGEGTDYANRFYQFLNSQAPDWVRQHGLTPRNVMDVANREMIEKYMVQSTFANSPYAASSNAMMDAAAAGNPTGNKSNETVSHVAAAMIGMRRLQQLGFQAFQQFAKDHNIDPNDIAHAYANFIGDWQKNIDVRALIFDMTRNSDLQKLKLSTTKPSKGGMSEEDKFRYTQKLAKDNDLYDQQPPPETR